MRIMPLVYQVFYWSPINKIVRNLLKTANRAFGLNLHSAISGTVSVPVGNQGQMILSSNETCYLTQTVFYDGALNYEFSSVFLDLVKGCSSFLDIGSNIGFFSILASKYNPDIKIVAFEPGKGSFYYLNENLKLNNCKNAQAVNAALSDKTGTIDFYEITNDKFPYLSHFLSGASTTVNMNYDLPTNTYPVKCFTLDQYVEAHGISQIDLIKLDTEFNEHLVLSKGQHTLKKFRPIIISEIYPDVAALFFAQVKDFDFVMFQYTQGRLKKIASFEEVALSQDRNFFLVPPEKIKVVEKHIAL